jgi:transcriptional regulator with XRE-family HTH domain
MAGRSMPRRTLVALPGLRSCRIRRALQQQQLANAAGVHLTTIQRIEAGGSASMKTLKSLAEALDVEPTELMQPPPEQRL